MTADLNKEFGKKLRKAIYPGQRLCCIEFSDGKSTNDFVPEEILEDPAQCAVEWFNEFKKEEYLSLSRGERQAVKVYPLPDTD